MWPVAEETTQGPDYSCGETMEECNQAYLDAMSVTCAPTVEPTMGPSLYESSASTLTQADIDGPSSNWMFNQQNNNALVREAFGLDSGMTLGVANDQYVVSDESGRVYETCVQHGASGNACSDEYVCWNDATAGSASEQRSALLAAAERNDFMIASCPALVGVCDQMAVNYYQDS